MKRSNGKEQREALPCLWEMGAGGTPERSQCGVRTVFKMAVYKDGPKKGKEMLTEPCDHVCAWALRVETCIRSSVFCIDSFMAANVLLGFWDQELDWSRGTALWSWNMQLSCQGVQIKWEHSLFSLFSRKVCYCTLLRTKTAGGKKCSE